MAEPRGVPPSLLLFAVLYGGLLVVAGVIGVKLIDVGPLDVPAGVLGFLPAIVCTNAVAELHGRDVAQRMVWAGFVPLVIATLLMQLVLWLPPSEIFRDQAALQTVLGGSMRLIVAGLIAYGVSASLDVTIFTWLRGRARPMALGLRALVSGLAAQLVDTLLFVTIAFYGVYPLATIIGGQLLTKAVVWAGMIPLLYAAVALGRRLDR
jgi:uncharacterized integral membrane protein (TIGR00697 family)